jgi:hypothetical protein
MNLADTLAARAAVLAYLIDRDRRAKDAIEDGLSDEAWRKASEVWSIARHDLIEAKTGRGWERHVKVAKRLGFH